MMQKPEASVFRVLRTNGEVIGTGFLVARNLGVTCAHVVKAIGVQADQSVHVRFASETQSRNAHVLNQGWSEADDVAFLSIEAPDVKPVHLGYAGTSSGKTFLAFGYPEGGSVEGRFANGIIQGLVDADEHAHGLLQIDGEKIDLGNSGSPVWETKTGLVVGMVVAKEDLRRSEQGLSIKDAPPVRLGYAIPAETFRIVHPALFDTSIRPYLSLDAFTESDAEFFFGRTRDVERMLDSLRHRPDFLVVLGASGSGKSSIVQAGLIPALRQGKLHESEQWEFLVTRPANQPFESLSNAGLSQLDQGLICSVQLWKDAHPNCKRLGLVIDQFEELLVGGISEDIQKKFIKQLADLLGTNLATVIITLRDDFFVPLLNRSEDLKPWLTNHLIHLSPNLSRYELEEIIQRPAEVAGLEFEEGLVQVILDDAMRISGLGGSSSCILPLLEFSLTQQWQKCQQTGLLTHSVYRDLGRVSGGLVQWAEKAYFALSKEQQPVARRILMKLVHLGDESQAIPDSRRYCLLNDLVESTVDHQVVIHLSSKNYRLITVIRDDQGKETVEIIHDALLREWGRLQGWLKDDRQFLEWRQSNESRVKAWVKTDDDVDQRDKSKLLRGSDLVEAEKWKSERNADLSQDEWEFVVESSILLNQENVEREAQAKREYNLVRSKAETEQKRAEEQAQAAQRLRVRSRLIVGLGFIALIVAVIAIMAWSRAIEKEKMAKQNAATALAESIRADHERNLAIEANTTSQAESHRADKERDKALRAEATAQSDARDKATAQAVAQAQAQKLSSNLLSFQAENIAEEYPQRGLLLAVEAWKRTKSEYPVAVHQTIRNLLSPPRGLPLIPTGISKSNLEFFFPNGDGNKLAAIDSDNRLIYLWHTKDFIENPATEPRILQGGFPTQQDSSLFKINSSWIAADDGLGTLYLWDMNKLVSEPIKYSSYQEKITSINISPNNQWLVIGTQDGITAAYDLTKPSENALILGKNQYVPLLIEFSSNGEWLIVVHSESQYSDREVVLWKIKNIQGNPPVHFKYPVTGNSKISFSPDAQWLAISYALEREVHLFNLNTSVPQPTTLTGDLGVTDLAFSPDGHWLAISGSSVRGIGSAAIWVWDMQDLAAAPFMLVGHTGGVFDIDFSLDGRWLASSSTDNTAILWNMIEFPTHTQPISLNVHEASIFEIEFSNDGNYLITSASVNSEASRLWDIMNLTSGSVVLADQIESEIVLSEDGQWLVAKTMNKQILLWNLNNINIEPYELRKQGNSIPIFAIHSGTNKLAASDGAKIYLWDLISLSKQPKILTTNSLITDLSFSPDGQWILATDDDESTGFYRWNLAKKETEPTLIGSGQHVGRNLEFSPDGNLLISSNGESTFVWETSYLDLPKSVLTGKGSFFEPILFSSDSEWLAIGGAVPAVSLWQVDELYKGPVYKYEYSASFNLAFSGDGHWLGFSLEPSSCRGWECLYVIDVLSLQKNKKIEPTIKSSQIPEIGSIAFSEDGRWLAVGQVNNFTSGPISIGLWDMENIEMKPVYLRTNETANILDTKFISDGKLLISAGSDGKLRLWPVQPKDLITQICQIVGRNFTENEWNEYFQGESYQRTCPNWPDQD